MMSIASHGYAQLGTLRLGKEEPGKVYFGSLNVYLRTRVVYNSARREITCNAKSRMASEYSLTKELTCCAFCVALFKVC